MSLIEHRWIGKAASGPLSLALWLQPGDRVGGRGSSRGNGFPAGRQTIESQEARATIPRLSGPRAGIRFGA